MKQLTIRTSFDLIASVPLLMGFVPENSVVLYVTKAAGGRPFYPRVDMPDSIADCDEIADMVLPIFEREGVTEAVLMFYTPLAQVAEYADRLIDRFNRVHFTDVMHVTPTHYRSLRCTDTACCPVEGKPYDLSTHPEIAEAVLEGYVILQTLADVASSLIGPVTGEVASSYRTHVELARAQMALLNETHPAHNPNAAKQFWKGEALWVQATLRRVRHDEVMLTDAEVGRMAAALVPLNVRDVAWAQIVTETARFYKEFFRNVTRRVPTEATAAPASLFAFASWQAGDGAAARIGIERALEIEPDYGMAHLLTKALAIGIRPDSWQPVDEYSLPVWDVA